MGNVGSSGCGAWPILGTKCQDILASAASISAVLFTDLSDVSQPTLQNANTKVLEYPFNTASWLQPHFNPWVETEQTVWSRKCVVNWNWRRVRQTGKETDGETDGYFVSPPVAGATGLAWLDARVRKKKKKKTKRRTEKKEKAPQSMRPFLF